MPSLPLGPYRLSKREIGVLECIADGMTNPEIAEELHIGKWTVHAHASRILQKLHAKTRAHAVAIAYHQGILEVPREN